MLATASSDGKYSPLTTLGKHVEDATPTRNIKRQSARVYLRRKLRDRWCVQAVGWIQVGVER